MRRLGYGTLALLAAGAVFSLTALALTVGVPSLAGIGWVLLPYVVLGGGAVIVRESRPCAGVVLVGSAIVVGYAVHCYQPAFMSLFGRASLSEDKFSVFEYLPLWQLILSGVTLLTAVSFWVALWNWPDI